MPSSISEFDVLDSVMVYRYSYDMFSTLHRIFSQKKVQLFVVIFLVSRIVLTVVGVLARATVHGPHDFVFHSQQWLAVWGVWDAGWYLQIAQHGYSSLESMNTFTLHQANYAFFPLYPVLMRVVAVLVQNIFVSGLLVANASLVLLLIFLYRYVRLESNSSTAMWTVIFLLCAPISFIFSGVFTESLYLLCVIAAFFYARKQRWFFVGLLGLCAALTRSVGVFLIIPMLIEYMQTIQWNTRRIRWNIVFLLLIPFGTALFMLYTFFLSGNALAFVHVQSAWGRGLVNPLSLIMHAVWRGDAAMRFNALASVVACALLIIGHKKLRASEIVFGIYSVFVPLMTGLESMARYTLVVFPLYIVLGHFIQRTWIRFAVALTLFIIQCMLMIFWTTGFDLVK